MQLIYRKWCTHQKREPTLHRIKKQKTFPISWTLTVSSQAVEEVICQLILDPSSLAPKKQLSMPKPPTSNIFKNDKYLCFLCSKPLQDHTLFRKYYDRGDLPIAVSFVGALRKLTWKMEPEHLDYHLHLPIFFEGLRET